MDIHKHMCPPLFEPEPDCHKPRLECGHEPPPFTLTEEMERTMRAMRETIDRMLRFEKHTKEGLDELTKALCEDNVTFKTTMNESWTAFVSEVNSEIQTFESSLTADVEQFQTDMRENYSNIVLNFEGRFTEFKTRYEQEYTELTTNVNNRYNSFVEAVNARCDLHNESVAQAMADYQRSLTTALNTFEQTMTQNFVDFTRSVNESNRIFHETWEQVITERLASQDGRISDAEMYMRANLGATLSTLIGDMQANGEFNEILENEVFVSLKSQSKMEYHTATTEAGPNECAEYCKAKGRVFYVPYGQTLEIDTPLDLTGLDVEINGTVRITSAYASIFCGGSSAKGEVRKIYIRNVVHSNYTDGCESVVLSGLMRGNVTIENAPVIKVYANGSIDGQHAVGYSTFNIGTCRKLILEDEANASGIGWINENLFNVNRVTELLSIVGHTFPHDNNVFIKPCIEGAKLVLKNCVRNKFYDIRSEGNFTAEFDENSRYNFILDNFFWAAVQHTDNIVDNGRNNVYTNSIYDSMENVPFYVISKKTFDKYTVYAPEKFTNGEQFITVNALYSKLLMDTIIPVDGVSFIGLDSDSDAFQLYVTPLDSNKAVIKTNPLDYTGGVKQNSDTGTYSPSDATSTAFLEIVDPAVKYLKITLDTCPTVVKSFTRVILYALGKKHESAKFRVLAEELKA